MNNNYSEIRSFCYIAIGVVKFVFLFVGDNGENEREAEDRLTDSLLSLLPTVLGSPVDCHQRPRRRQVWRPLLLSLLRLRENLQLEVR